MRQSPSDGDAAFGAGLGCPFFPYAPCSAPGPFRQAVTATFEHLLQAGAHAAWIGREGYLCDPPDLFSPDCMSGGVLAVALPDGRVWGTVDPDQPLAAVDDAVLEAVRQATAGLSAPRDHEARRQGHRVPVGICALKTILAGHRCIGSCRVSGHTAAWAPGLSSFEPHTYVDTTVSD